MAKYKCPTLGDCDRANAGEIFERAPGEELKCPGCAMQLEPRATPGTGTGSGASAGMALKVAIAAAVLALVAGGGYFYTKRTGHAPEVAQAAPAAQPADTTLATAAPPAPAVATVGAGGIAPSDADTNALKRAGESDLRNGKAEQAEASSAKAVTNEMLKVAIAEMAQGKLDEAEKELESARAHDGKEPLVYYNMAVLRLKQARTDDALKQFEAAFMNGFTHFKEMDADPDLDALRKLPRFAALVKQYRPAGT